MPDRSLHIPELCRNSSILITLILTELVVMLAWLINAQNTEMAVFGLWSMYALWAVILCSYALCQMRRKLTRLPYWGGVFIAVASCLMILLIIELALGVLYQHANPPGTGLINWPRLLRVWAVALIVLAIALRLFTLMQTMDSRIEAETKSRLDALQSRIQPHFLFNSLNTISELVATSPDEAEEAIQALAMLFRVSLEEGGNRHSLEKELRLCQRYVDLEMWRINGKVKLDWDVNVSQPQEWMVPKLLLQPLLENAIKYGMDAEASERETLISISVRESKNVLSIKVVNPVSSNSAIPKGHGIALENIRERLFVLYDDKQSFNVRSNKHTFEVTIQIPKT